MSDFLEGVVRKFYDDGYREIDKVNLENGDYKKSGGGYYITLIGKDLPKSLIDSKDSISKFINGRSSEDTGYVIITNDGIRGSWSGQRTTIKDGYPIDEDVYKIMIRVEMLREDKLEKILN